MKYRSKEVFDAEQLTEELAMDCLLNNKRTSLGFNVSGGYNQHTMTLNHASFGVWSNDELKYVLVGNWVVVDNNGDRWVYTDDEFKAKFEPYDTDTVKPVEVSSNGYEYWNENEERPSTLPSGCQYEMAPDDWVEETTDPDDWGYLRRRWPVQ